jgi:hypothetical protein
MCVWQAIVRAIPKETTMSYQVPQEYQYRTQQYQHPNGAQIDSADQAVKIATLINEALDLLTDLNYAKNRDFELHGRALELYRGLTQAYSDVYNIDIEFGYNGAALPRVWKYPQYRITFQEAE